MKGKTKFKKTPIGEIPEDWEVVRLKDVIKEAKPGFASGKRDENGIIQLRMNNITTEGKVTLKEYLKVPVPSNIKDYLLKPGDVLFNNTNSVDLIGKTAIFRGECQFCTYSNHITRIRVDSSRVIPEWIMYYFMELWRVGYFRQICVRYVGQASVKKTDLLNMPLPLPPLPEQKKIAEILRTVDEVIEKTDEAIEKTERLKKGLMGRLLTKGIGHERFKKTELGEIPEEWRVVRLGDVASSFQYGLSTKLKDSGRYPVIKMDSILNGKVLPINLKYTDLDEITFRKYKLEKGDVLINRTNSYELVGRTGVFMLEGDYVFASYLIRLKPNLNVADPMFLTLYLIFAGDRLRQLATRAASQANINASNLKKFKIPLLPIEEQKQIAKILSTVDRKLELLRERREKLERVKRGLMKDLLTGKRRVMSTR